MHKHTVNVHHSTTLQKKVRGWKWTTGSAFDSFFSLLFSCWLKKNEQTKLIWPQQISRKKIEVFDFFFLSSTSWPMKKTTNWLTNATRETDWWKYMLLSSCEEFCKNFTSLDPLLFSLKILDSALQCRPHNGTTITVPELSWQHFKLKL